MVGARRPHLHRVKASLRALQREKVCERCPTPCAHYLDAAINFEKPATSCPLPEQRWVIATGLGDVIAAIAQPIAQEIDASVGTNVAGCGGCSQRQEAVNAAGRAIKRLLS
jgi:hypothetical protein